MTSKCRQLHLPDRAELTAQWLVVFGDSAPWPAAELELHLKFAIAFYAGNTSFRFSILQEYRGGEHFD
jgi:hypothetical protein